MELKQAVLFAKLLIIIILREVGGIPYKLCSNGRSNCENIYIWSRDQRVFMSLFNVTFQSAYIKADALQGKTVRVIADNMLPYITSSNHSQDLGGYLGDIWSLIEETLKFKSQVSSVFYDSGLNLITSDKADVMLAAVVVKKGLINVVYSQPYFYNWYQIYMKASAAKGSSLSYLKTFDNLFWIIIIAIFLVLTVTSWLTVRFLNSVKKRSEPNISIPSCFLGIISGFINQGFDLKLTSYSGRMQVLLALVLGIVLYSAMNAVLVAQLAAVDMPFPFTSLEDIATKGTHSLCLRSNSFVYNNFTDENREIVPKWRRILNGAPCLDINNQTNLAEILCKNKVVVLENRVVMANVLKKYQIPCEIASMQKKMFETGNSFLLLKSFKYKALVDKLVKKMRCTGILQRLENKWVRREEFVNINLQQAPPQVTLDHVKGIIFLYCGMKLLSILILFVEILYFKYFDDEQKQLQNGCFERSN